MAAWLLCRCSRSCEALLGPCKSRFGQTRQLGELTASSWHCKGAPWDEPLVPGLDYAKGDCLGKIHQPMPVEAWLAPHLVQRIVELANGGIHGLAEHKHFSNSNSSKRIGTSILSGFGNAGFGGSRGYATVATAVEETVDQGPAPWWVGRLETNGVELIGQLAAESKPIKIRPKQLFAVVQVGPHQFKVTPNDVLYVEKLNGVDIKSKVLLKKVLLLGSRTKTIVGRPLIANASVTATVEAQTKDAKVLILKKRRRKNSRRLKGHRQELTRLRILDITGIEEDREEVKPARLHAQEGVVAKFKTPEPGKVTAYAFQPKPLPQSRDLKKQRRSPAVPGYGRRFKRRLTFGAERRRRRPTTE